MSEKEITILNDQKLVKRREKAEKYLKMYPGRVPTYLYDAS